MSLNKRSNLRKKKESDGPCFSLRVDFCPGLLACATPPGLPFNKDHKGFKHSSSWRRKTSTALLLVPCFFNQVTRNKRVAKTATGTNDGPGVTTRPLTRAFEKCKMRSTVLWNRRMNANSKKLHTRADRIRSATLGTY